MQIYVLWLEFLFSYGFSCRCLIVKGLVFVAIAFSLSCGQCVDITSKQGELTHAHTHSHTPTHTHIYRVTHICSHNNRGRHLLRGSCFSLTLFAPRTVCTTQKLPAKCFLIVISRVFAKTPLLPHPNYNYYMPLVPRPKPAARLYPPLVLSICP